LLTVVGMGNPGPAYSKTRHNAGFMLLDGIVEGRFIEGAVFKKSGLDSLKTFFGSRSKFKKTSGPFTNLECELSGNRFLLVKPTTYMNESGKAIASLVTRGIIKDYSELLVIVDDVDLDLGSIRLRPKGSAGGHNGLRSIITHIGTNEFARLKIGVGPRPEGSEMVCYVLSSFIQEEWELLEKSLSQASEVVENWITGGYENPQNIISRINTNKNISGG